MFSFPLVRGWVVVIAAILLTGCVVSRFTRYDPAAPPDRRTPADHIRFYDGQQPTCAFTEVGHVSAEGVMLASWGRVVRAARERAYQLGGDAIVRIREATRISGATISRNGGSVRETTSLSGTVIRFTDSSCRE
jgi:hypothetical protein